jgi:hypothetical protein
MSILDDAIREHLELKRAHGADEGVLKKLEDDAFGPPQRPDEIDPFAEAPTEFLTSPGQDAADAPAIFDEEERSGRRPDIADLQEAPPAGDAVTEAPIPEDAPPPPFEDAAPRSTTPFLDELAPPPADAPPPSPADAADIPLPPPPGEAAADLAPPFDLDAPVEESQQPVAEEPAAAEASIAPDAGPGAEERHAIAEQPTQMFDVQAHVDAEAAAAPEVPAEQTSPDAEAPFVDQPTPTDEAPVDQAPLTDEAPVEQASPSDEELVDAAQAEPHAAPPAPEEPGTPAPAPVDLGGQKPLDTRGPDAEVSGHPPTEEESAEYDFFNEQRLSDELDQALDAPTGGERAMPQYEEDVGAQGAIFDFESQTYEEDPSEEVLRRADERAAAEEAPSEEHPRAAEPPSEEAPLDATVEQPRPNFDPPSEEAPQAPSQSAAEGEDEYDPATGHEDVLEDTPRFLEDAPEDDDLWFEQKPPKDFDLD